MLSDRSGQPGRKLEREWATYCVGGDGARPESDEPVPVGAEDIAGQQGLVYALVGVFLEVFEEWRW